EPAPIVVAKKWRGPVRSRQVHQMIQQQFQLRLELRRQRKVVLLQQNREMEVEVGGVAMVVTRLLEIDAVRLYVPRQLRDDNLETEITPTLRVAKLRQQQADIKKTERFSGQMRVGTEVSREKRFEMRRVQIQKLQHSQHDVRADRRRLREKS